MATSINNSGITFPDSTTQTTAATGVPSTLTGVGATIIMYSTYSGNVSVGSTLSGSYLFYASNNYLNTWGAIEVSGNRVNATSTFVANIAAIANNVTFTVLGVGTWMVVGGHGTPATTYNSCSNNTTISLGIYRRIS